MYSELLLGGGLEAAGGLLGESKRKKANKATKARRTAALGNVDLAGSTAKQDVVESFGDAKASIGSQQASRGLTGSTAFDAALNSNLGERQRSMSRINEGVAREKNAILGQFDDQVSPNNWLTGLGGLAAKAGTLDALKEGGGGGLDSLLGIGGNEAVTKAQLNGKESKARLGGGGNWMDWILRTMGR